MIQSTSSNESIQTEKEDSSTMIEHEIVSTATTFESIQLDASVKIETNRFLYKFIPENFNADQV